MTTCKYENLLVDHCHNELPAGKKGVLKRHLKGCPDCRRSLAEISRLAERTREIPVPYPTHDELAAIKNRLHGRPAFPWKPALVGVSLAAAAVAAVVIINKPEALTEAPPVVAGAESSEMQRSGGPLRPPLRPPALSDVEGKGAAIVKSSEGEQSTGEVLAKDSHRPRRGVSAFVTATADKLQYAPAEGESHAEDTAQAGAPESEKEIAIASSDESSLVLRGGAVGAPRPAGGGAGPTGAAQPAAALPAARIIELVPTATSTPAPEQREKVLVKHNRINPGLGEKMVFSIKSAVGEHVSIRIYNRVGELVRTLADEEVSAGVNEFDWNGSNDRGVVLASGIYIVVIETPGFQLREKGVIVK